MIAVLVTALGVLCCVGLGITVLRALRLDREFGFGEHVVFAYAVGFGALGWIVFPLGVSGLLSRGWLLGVLGLGAMGVLSLLRDRSRVEVPRLDAIGLTLAVLLAAVGVLDVIEALPPPTDADSLAYHFALPKQFIAEGRVTFIPRVVDGAVPLLAQMTYIPMLALGGERALTLWTMASGWAAGALVFVLARRYLPLNWSLAVALVFLTTPAVIYGAGSGQVETRIALFALVSAWGIGRSLETGNWRFAALAGLGGGFFAASKYTGLLFLAAAGAVLLLRRPWPGRLLAFGVGALAAGFQWYGWNWLHTGDPVFPMLFGWLGVTDPSFWNPAQDALFKEAFPRVEMALPRDPLAFVAYPFLATLNPDQKFDSGRTGLGPYGLLILPFAIVGAWRYRARIGRDPLLAFAAIAVLYYALWFFLVPSQRVRHLLPVWPLLLIPLTVAAARLARGTALAWPLTAGLAAALLLQTAGAMLFSHHSARYVFGNESRDAFLARNVRAYSAVPWINANLQATARVATTERTILYLFDVPSFLAHDLLQSALDMLPERADIDRAKQQMERLGITHALIGAAGYPSPFDLLMSKGCLVVIRQFENIQPQSRTLGTFARAKMPLDLLHYRPESCRS